MTQQHILFVENRGQALQRVMQELTADRPDWHIVRVTTSDAAIKVITQYQVSIVVAGCEMEWAQCEQMFRLVQEQDAAVVRIALVEDAGQNPLKEMAFAHQFLLGSCSPARIEQTLEGALRVWNMTKETPVLLKFVAGLESLPTPPMLYFEIKDELDTLGGSLQSIARLVARDPALTAKILRIANSGLYAMPRTIADLGTAIGLLGTEMLLSMVLGAHLYSQLPVPGLDLDKMWLHSMAVSLLAKQIAEDETADRHQASSAGVAGLLHDVGQLVLLAKDAAIYFAVLRHSEGKEANLIETEQKQFGVDHALLGGYLLALWGLPDAIVTAVVSHHSLARRASQPLSASSQAVYVAEWLLQEYDMRKEILSNCTTPESLDMVNSSHATKWWNYVNQLVEQGIVS